MPLIDAAAAAAWMPQVETEGRTVVGLVALEQTHHHRPALDLAAVRGDWPACLEAGIVAGLLAAVVDLAPGVDVPVEHRIHRTLSSSEVGCDLTGCRLHTRTRDSTWFVMEFGDHSHSGQR